MFRRVNDMMRLRSLAALAVAVLALSFAATADAAIYTFDDGYLLGSSVVATETLDVGTIKSGFPKAKTAAPSGAYETGDSETMAYDVGFKGQLDPDASGAGRILIGRTVFFTGLAGDEIRAEISNDNDDARSFGLWYQLLDNTFVKGTAIALSADTVGQASISISGVTFKAAGFYVEELSGREDTYHVSLRTTPDAQILPLPEPGSMVVWGLGAGLIGAVGFYKRRRKVS